MIPLQAIVIPLRAIVIPLSCDTSSAIVIPSSVRLL